MPSSSQIIRCRPPYCRVTDLEEEIEVANLLWCYTEALVPHSASKAGQPSPDYSSCSKSSRGSSRTSGVSIPPAVFPPALAADVLPSRPERVRVSSFGGMPPMDHLLKTIGQNCRANKPIAQNHRTPPPDSRSSSPLLSEYSYHDEVSISLVLNIVSATFAFFPLAFFKLASFVSSLASSIRSTYRTIIARRRTSRFGYKFGMKRNKDFNPSFPPPEPATIKKNLVRGPRKLAFELADPSTLSPPTTNPVKIDLRATFAFGSLPNFPKLLQYFSHENINYDPEQESINAGNVSSTVVEHRLYWEGQAQVLPGVMSAVIPCLLTQLVMNDCNVALRDVIATLAYFPALEILDIRDIRGLVSSDSSSSNPPLLPTSTTTVDEFKHRLSSLTFTSFSRLNQLFKRVEFTNVTAISLRLFEDGNNTGFQELFSSVGMSLQSFRLRGAFEPTKLNDIEKDHPNVTFDTGHVCSSTRPRKRRSR